MKKRLRIGIERHKRVMHAARRLRKSFPKKYPEEYALWQGLHAAKVRQLGADRRLSVSSVAQLGFGWLL